VIRILSPRDYRVMPWKNGGGTTTEIWIHPEGASWDDFDWRVGIADIARSGPFSSLPGIDRSILLLESPEGSGMTLTIDGKDVAMPLHDFIDFRGEAKTDGTLRGAPVRDFNVMSRRGRLRHRCGFTALADGGNYTGGAQVTHFVYVAGGIASLADAGGERTIEAGMSVLASRHPFALHAHRGAARLVWAVFENNH
jgi:environmental stress-induced protein Ves